MKTVVVLGALGMAGHIMTEYLNNTGAYKVLGVARQSGPSVSDELDVLDFDELAIFLQASKADVVINCIGVLVSASNSEISRAILINSYLPHLLGSMAEKLKFKLIHISTDCVFSGKLGSYSEDSFRDGDDNYARTKALGEITTDNHLTIRTSIIGPELKSTGTGLMDWFFKQDGEVSGYSKAYWSGVTTLELAKATHDIIQQNLKGLIHLCPSSKISKFELLGLFNEIWMRGCDIKENDSYAVDKSLISTRDDFLYCVPDYKEMLDELKGWTSTHPQYYPHYNFN
jgi:dTDP-4-dehydrorhamnose reductase